MTTLSRRSCSFPAPARWAVWAGTLAVLSALPLRPQDRLPPPPEYTPPYSVGEEDENDIWLEAEGSPGDDCLVYENTIGRVQADQQAYAGGVLATERKTLAPCGYCYVKYVFPVKKPGKYLLRIANQWHLVPIWWALDPKSDSDFRHVTRDKVKQSKANWKPWGQRWANLAVVHLGVGQHALKIKINEHRQDLDPKVNPCYSFYMDAIALKWIGP